VREDIPEGKPSISTVQLNNVKMEATVEQFEDLNPDRKEWKKKRLRLWRRKYQIQSCENRG
jgi:MoaA/NifB/PqqE/SkfB family radical SAM enzyme